MKTHPPLDEGLNSLEEVSENFEILIQQINKSYRFSLSKSSLRPCHDEINLFLVISLGIAVVLFLLAIAFVFFIKFYRKKTVDYLENIDVNPDYGTEEYDNSQAVLRDANDYYFRPGCEGV